MTEALTPTEKSKKQRDNSKNATKNFDYTTIADRLHNDCGPIININKHQISKARDKKRKQ